MKKLKRIIKKVLKGSIFDYRYKKWKHIQRDGWVIIKRSPFDGGIIMRQDVYDEMHKGCKELEKKAMYKLLYGKEKDDTSR